MKRLMSTLLASLALLAVGCSSPRQELDDLDPATAGMASISFDLNVAAHQRPEARLRADDNFIEDKGQLWTMNGLRVVLYKQDESGNPTEVAYAFDKDIRVFQDDREGADLLNPESNGGLLSITGISGIAPADYTIIFFSTPSQAIISATTPGKDYSELKRPLDIDFTNETIHGNDLKYSSKMYSSATNIDNPTKVSREDLLKAIGSSPLKLGSITLRATDAAILVKYENIRKEPGESEVTAEDLVQLYPDVLNKTLLLFPQMAEDKELSLSIPMDNNYSGLKSWSEDQFRENFSYSHIKVSHPYFYRANSSNKEITKPIVVPENTTAPGDLCTQTVTRLIMIVQVTPTSSELPYSVSSKMTWFSYKGKNYDWIKFAGKYAEAANLYKSQNPTPTDDQRELLEIGLAINTALKSGTTAPQLGDPLANKPEDEGYDSEDLKIYTKGYAFYSIPIRHFSDKVAPSLETIGRYAVVRNTLYLITIQSITHLGAPTYESLVEGVSYTDSSIASFTIEQDDRTRIEMKIDL